jgi:hypothetical protein
MTLVRFTQTVIPSNMGELNEYPIEQDLMMSIEL